MLKKFLFGLAHLLYVVFINDKGSDNGKDNK